MIGAVTVERTADGLAALAQFGLSGADWHAVGLSLRVSMLATVCCALVGVPVGAWLGGGRSRRRYVVDVVLMAPLVVPPVVTGFGLLLLLRWIHVDILFTAWAAGVASGVVGLPLLIRTVRASVERTDLRLGRVGATLGASPWRIFLTITLPLSWRGVVGGALLCWARGFGEFGATIVVAGSMPGETRTLPVAIWTSLQSKPLGACVGLVLAAVLISVVAVGLSEWIIQKSPNESDHVRY